MPRLRLAIALALPLAACTSLERHTAEPYRSDPARAAALEQEATAFCASRRPDDPPTHPFRFDGCSMFPDGDWVACCQRHDFAYWCGGSAADRSAADRELERCVAEKHPALGPLMWAGVRVGGGPWVPAWFRWGFGHDYPACYTDAAAPGARP